MAEASAASRLVDIFASPARAFAAIRERPQPWLPLLLLIVGAGAVSLLYTTSVDLGWFIEHQMRSSGRDLTEEQIKQAVDAATRMPPLLYGAIGAVSSALLLVILTAVTALYYSGVSLLTGDGVRYRQWYGLVCWCAAPALLSIVAQLVNILANDPRFMPQEAINPLAFGNLAGIDRAGATLLQRLLLGFDVTTVWSVLLAIMGYQAFTKSSLVKAAVVVLAPIVVIVGVGTLVSLLRGAA